MRRWLLFVHRWMGLTLGIIFAIASLTGAILVYETPLDEWLDGPRFATTPGRVDPAVVEAAATARWPEGRLIRVDWPTPASNVYRVQSRVGNLRENLILDAGSGMPLKPRPVNRMLRLVRSVHVSLTLGPVGSRVVYWATVAAMLGIVIGIYLWWPGIRRFARGFRIRVQRDAYTFNFDLHQVTGIVAMPLLLVMCLSAALFRQGRLVDAATRLLHGPAVEPAWADITSPRPGAGNATPQESQATDKSATAKQESQAAIGPASASPAALRAVADAAMAEAGGGALVRITIPETDGASIEAYIADAPGLAPGDSLFIALDRATGLPLRKRIGAPHVRFDRALNNRLHQARVGGPIVRALYAFSCVVGFLLLPTGASMWWIRRGRKAEAAERRSMASATGDAD